MKIKCFTEEIGMNNYHDIKEGAEVWPKIE